MKNFISSEHFKSASQLIDNTQNQLNQFLQSGKSSDRFLETKLSEIGNCFNLGSEFKNQTLNQLQSTQQKIAESLGNKVNLQPEQLKGYVAEHFHVRTFNQNAKQQNSDLYAKVMNSNKANSVDIGIYNKSEQLLHKVQAKYCKNAQETQKAFSEKSYQGQQKLVSSDQVQYISNAIDRLSAIDSKGRTIESTPLSLRQSLILAKNIQANSNQNIQLKQEFSNAKDILINSVALRIASDLKAMIQNRMTQNSEQLKPIQHDLKQVGKNAVETLQSKGVEIATHLAMKYGQKIGLPKWIVPEHIPIVINSVMQIGDIAIRLVSGEITLTEAFSAVSDVMVSTICEGIEAFCIHHGTAIGETIGNIAETMLSPFVGTEIANEASQLCTEFGEQIGEMVGEGVSDLIQSGYEQICDFCKEHADEFVAQVIESIEEIEQQAEILEELDAFEVIENVVESVIEDIFESVEEELESVFNH